VRNDRGVRRVIEGLPNLVWGGVGKEVIKDDLATDDLTIVPVMRDCLAHSGERFSKVYLAGTSCVAFYIGWRADSLRSAMGGSVYMFPEDREPGLVNLFRAMGRNFEIVRKSKPKRLWEAGVKSIDAGRPVLCVEWEPVAHRGHWAVLAGYDHLKGEFLGRSYDIKPYAEYVSLRPENLHYILVIGEKSREKLSSREAALGALHCAIQMSRTGIRTGEETGAYGLVAYERDAQMIPEGMKPAVDGYGLLEHWLFWRLEILYHCRCYAVEYLREIADEFSSANRKYEQTARGRYERLIELFDENVRITYGSEAEKWGTNLLWCGDGRERPIRQLFSALEGRHRFADLLLEMRNLESGAIDEIGNLAQAETS